MGQGWQWRGEGGVHCPPRTAAPLSEPPLEVAPVDLNALVATILGISIVLIPVVGFTARFALKPLVEALASMRGQRAREAEVSLLEQRVQLLERQVEVLQRGLPQGSLLELPERARPVSRD